jgi:threonine/homoserine/homoserine lactone efflux protein
VKYVLAIFPSAGVLFIFWLAIKSIVEADRRERAAEARFDRERAEQERAEQDQG